MKLSTKLILAFLLISIFSTGIIVLFTRALTNREFDKFISDRYETELAEDLARYYSRNQTWDGVEYEFKRFGHEAYEHNGPLLFSIANEDGNIVVAGKDKQVGEPCSQEEYEDGAPIQVDGKTVGVLLLPVSPDRSPLDYEFLRRLNGSIFFSAVATIILALFLGILLSRSISRPIRELTKATHTMTDGNLGQQVPVRSRDEIGELAQSFNKMSADLARSFNLRKQMTADIAHELRTPLSIIMGYTESLRDGVLPSNAETFDIIYDEAEHLSRLVQDLRTLSLADAGELSLNLGLIDPVELLRNVAARYAHQAEQKGVGLQVEVGSELPDVEVDQGRMEQVLSNLVSNALRYTPAQGQITLSAHQKSSDLLVLQVQDTGVGIAPEDVERIFDRFYKVDASRTAENGESGLGLAIARSLVLMHNGRISVESVGGSGSTFRIELPYPEDS